MAISRNAAHAAFTIVREEGLGTLYRGVTLTALRQATNQGKSSQLLESVVRLVSGLLGAEAVSTF